MLTEFDINKHNFSKIGKYISNKLHHIHKRDSKKHHTAANESIPDQKEKAKEKIDLQLDKKAKTARKKEQWYEPCVGTYRVNYSVIDKYLLLDSEICTSPTLASPLLIFMDRSTGRKKSLLTPRITQTGMR